MILAPTTTLHWLQGVDPADGYEDEAVVWRDRAQVPGHVDLSTSVRVIGGGSEQWVITSRFKCDTPPIAVDLYWRVRDETTGVTYQLITLDHSPLFDCMSGTLQDVTGVA